MSIKFCFTSAEHNWLVDLRDPDSYFSNHCKKVILIRASALVADAMCGMALMDVKHTNGEFVFGFVDIEPSRAQEVFLNTEVDKTFWGMCPHSEVAKDRLAIWVDDGRQITVPLRADVRAKLIESWNDACFWNATEPKRRLLVVN